MNFLQAIPGRIFGSVLERVAAGGPLLAFMGHSERCGRPKICWIDGTAVRTDPRRFRLLVSCRLHPRRHHRHGSGAGRHGADFDTGMMRYGYNIRYITGVLAIPFITQLVPPSLVLIVR